MLPTSSPISRPAQPSPPVSVYDPTRPLPVQAAHFRSNEQLRDHLFSLQREFPQLVKVEDIGDSTETHNGTARRDLLAVRITAGVNEQQRPLHKPKLLLVGGIHPREAANPEIIVRSLEELVRGYGIDPVATHLLQTREFVAVPIANPDGHAAVEQGFATGNGHLIFQRKNSSGLGGVDLNRNFDLHWGTVGGSRDPANNNYAGAGPASEHEVQALQSFIKRERPNFYLDLHSRGEIVLYPWGHTATPPRDAAGLQAIASQLTLRNGYKTSSSHEQRPDSGTSKDWVYGTLGIPAFTLETGTDYFQPGEQFAQSMSRNRVALRYAAAIADAPFEHAFAPSTDSVSVDSSSGQVQATMRSLPTGAAIIGAELVSDPNARPGSGIAMQALDGAFGGVQELVQAALPAMSTAAPPQPATTRELLYVRGQAADGSWGPLTAAWRKLTPA